MTGSVLVYRFWEACFVQIDGMLFPASIGKCLRWIIEVTFSPFLPVVVNFPQFAFRHPASFRMVDAVLFTL